jgi:hypothetical protein
VNPVDNVNRTSQEAGLDEVRSEDITQLLDSHEQQHSNKDLEDVVNPLNAELNPSCKSQIIELFCRVFKFCA